MYCLEQLDYFNDSEHYLKDEAGETIEVVQLKSCASLFNTKVIERAKCTLSMLTQLNIILPRTKNDSVLLNPNTVSPESFKRKYDNFIQTRLPHHFR
jgi:hypothetical protein